MDYSVELHGIFHIPNDRCDTGAQSLEYGNLVTNLQHSSTMKNLLENFQFS